MPNKVGRPSRYNPKYCNDLIEHMAKGLSYESFAGTLDVSRRVLYDWEKAHPEFLHAKEAGLEKCRVFWENLGVTHILNESSEGGSKSLNASVWIFNMKNRFGWRDRQPEEVDRVTVNTYAHLSDEELDEKLKQLEEKE